MKDFFEANSIWFSVIVFPSCIIFVLSLIAVIHNKKKKAQATVTAMRQQRAFSRTSRQPNAYGVFIYKYYITFRLETGKEIERECSETLYNKLQQNDNGLLTYNRNFVIAFDEA